MVMLHLDQGNVLLSRLLTSPFRSEVLRMRVTGEAGGAKVEELFEAALRVKPGIERLGVFQIAHMLGDKRLGAANEGERALLLRARREQHGRGGARRCRHIADCERSFP